MKTQRDFRTAYSGSMNQHASGSLDYVKQPLALLPEAWRHIVREGLFSRRRTVWDARAILRPQVGRWAELTMDDGQYASRVVQGKFEDVVHRPATGFALVFRELRPAKAYDPGDLALWRHERTALPLSIIGDLPEPFRFLRQPRQGWPFPPPWVACVKCGFGANAGRFCVSCGKIVRSGSARRMGEAFSVLQKALAERDVRGCDCGARIEPWGRFCSKCGEDHG